MEKDYKATDEIDNLDSWLLPAINSVMTYKGQVDSMDDLPKTDNKLGDAYYILSAEKQYAYNGIDWELIDDTHGSGGTSSVVRWDDIKGKPDVFYVHPVSPAGAKENGLYKITIDENGHVTEAVAVTMEDLVHTHEIADVEGLQTEIDGKADAEHTHDAADITSGVIGIDRIPNIPDSKIVGMDATKLIGTISQSNLPSYVDDVVEVENYDALPETGEAGKIYVDLQTNKAYRWGGSAYAEISASIALGETSATAFRGDYGKAAYNHAQAKGSEFASGFYKITTNAEGHVTGVTAVTKADITSLGIPAQDTTYSDATISASGLMSATDKTKLDGMDNAIAGAVASEASLRESADDELQTNIDGKANLEHVHEISDVTGLQTALNGKANSTHTHDDATTDASGFMSAIDKTKLDGIANNANNYTHPASDAGALESNIYKITTDANGHIVAATAITKDDIMALGIPGADTDTTYTAGSGLALTGTEFGIADGGVIGRHLDDNCIMERNIVVGSVTSDKIPALAITTPKLVDNAVTAMKMADDAVATRSLQDGAVTADKIADGVIPDVATTSTDGLMSSTDKTKLDGMVELTQEEINEIFNPTE